MGSAGGLAVYQLMGHADILAGTLIFAGGY